MLMIRKVVVGDAERALVYKNRRFQRVLGPGVYRLRGFGLQVAVHDLATAEYTGKDTEALVQALGATLADTFQLVDLDMQ